MKTCTRFHLEDLEQGDKIFLQKDSNEDKIVMYDSEAEYVEGVVTIARIYKTHNFGWAVDFYPDPNHYKTDTAYLGDYDIVRLAEAKP